MRENEFVSFNFKLPKRLLESIRKEASKEAISIAAWIRLAILEKLNKATGGVRDGG